MRSHCSASRRGGSPAEAVRENRPRASCPCDRLADRPERRAQQNGTLRVPSRPYSPFAEVDPSGDPVDAGPVPGAACRPKFVPSHPGDVGSFRRFCASCAELSRSLVVLEIPLGLPAGSRHAAHPCAGRSGEPGRLDQRGRSRSRWIRSVQANLRHGRQGCKDPVSGATGEYRSPCPHERLLSGHFACIRLPRVNVVGTILVAMPPLLSPLECNRLPTKTVSNA